MIKFFNKTLPNLSMEFLKHISKYEENVQILICKHAYRIQNIFSIKKYVFVNCFDAAPNDLLIFVSTCIFCIKIIRSFLTRFMFKTSCIKCICQLYIYFPTCLV